MLTLLFQVAACVAYATQAALPVATPDWMPRVLASVDAAMDTVESGRRIKAGSADIPVQAMKLPVNLPPVAFRPGEKPVIGLDPKRTERLTAVEFELAVARERARAASDRGIQLVEAEQAAEQAVIEYSLDRAQASEEFGRKLRSAAQTVLAREKIRSEDSVLPGGEEGFDLLSLASRDPDRQAQLIVRFARDPDEFYWTVERELLRAPDPVGLFELESFLWMYAERLDRAECRPRGRYCALDGRFMRPALVAAAKAAVAEGGLDRLREGLEDFRGEAAAKLRARAQAWLKKL